jgi:hypothetical protein
MNCLHDAPGFASAPLRFRPIRIDSIFRPHARDARETAAGIAMAIAAP